MALSGFSTSNYIRVASGLVTAVPMTFACWCRTSDNTPPGFQTLINIGATSGGNNRFVLSLSQTSGLVRATVINNGGTVDFASSSQVPQDTWFHALAIFRTNTDRQAYLDGVGGSVQTDSNTPTAGSIGATAIGVHNNASADAASNEWIAECGIWNVALGADAIAALAKGIPPLAVRPEALVAYLPLVRDIIPRKGSGLALTGSLSPQNHPRIYGLAA